MSDKLTRLFRPLAACGLIFALGGCVAAVPLAHMAASATQASSPCSTGSGCNPSAGVSSFSDLAKQLDQRVQAFTGIQSNDPQGQAAAAAK
jgi:hypothetical protein